MTELLSKINLTKKKIDDVVSKDSLRLNSNGLYSPCRLINAKKKSENDINGVPVKEIKLEIMSAYSQIKDLIDNYTKLIMIKNGVNSVAKVNIAGQELTIAEALAYNTSTVKNYHDSLIRRLINDGNEVNKIISDYNKIKFSDQAINGYLSAALGGISTGDIKNVDTNIVDDLLKKYHEQNDMEYIDPLNLFEEVDHLHRWYSDFYNTVNFKLSEINSRLIIEYDLDQDVPTWRIVNLDEIEKLNNYTELSETDN